MFPIEKTLVRHFATLDDALAPLRSARPWMKCVEGDLGTPESYFVYQYGEGKQRIRYQVRVSARKEVDGYAVVVRLERVSVAELLTALIPLGAVCAVLGFKVPGALLYAVPILLVAISIRLAHVLRHTDSAWDEFSLPYET